MTMPDETYSISIDKRFRGPPRSGNGGYCSGILGLHVPAPCQVMLKAPPALDRTFYVKKDGARASLFDGDDVIAVAEPASFKGAPPEAVRLQEAQEASSRYVGHENHLCPGCFVCGPERAAGDGLRIFAGPVNGRDIVAAPWTPDADLADTDGLVKEEFIWAALDCPTYFALPIVGELALLGSMVVQVYDRPPVCEAVVLCAQALGAEGRKHLSASAAYSADGSLLARAECVWITLKEDQFGIYDVEGKTS